MTEPTQRQRAVLGAIRRHFDKEGVAPTLREIALALRIDPKSVAQHLDRLERKGYIRRRPRESRNIRLTDLYFRVLGDGGFDGRVFPDGRVFSGDPSFADAEPLVSSGALPLVGQIAAGQPLLAEENLEGHVHLGDLFGPEGEVFLLRVQGDSMIDAGIRDGDLVAVRAHADISDAGISDAGISDAGISDAGISDDGIPDAGIPDVDIADTGIPDIGIQNGAIAVVVVNNEATVKRLYVEGRMLRLQPENRAFQPLLVDTRRDAVRIVGPVIGVIRKV